MSKSAVKGNVVYHVLNRANGRLRIFKKPRDFEAFEEIIAEGLERFDMRMCGFCVMGNHWHLVLWPRADDDWIIKTVGELGLESTIRPRGRPRKES